MISRFFILGQEGIVLAEKDFRQELPVNTIDIFMEEFESKMNREFFFHRKGVHFCYVAKEDLIFLSCSQYSVPPSIVLDFVYKFINLLEDILESVGPESLRANRILLQELLEAMVDFGYESLTSSGEVINNVSIKGEDEGSFASVIQKGLDATSLLRIS